MKIRMMFMATGLLLALAACNDAAPKGQDTAANTGAPLAPLRMQPGLWQQDRAVTLAASAGAPAAAKCVTPEDALSANGSDAEIRAALEKQAQKDGCTLDTVNINGPTIAFTQSCSGTPISVSIEYHGDSSVTTMSGAGIPPTKITGKRIGDC